MTSCVMPIDGVETGAGGMTGQAASVRQAGISLEQTRPTSIGSPRVVLIPSIGVRAPVVALGLTAKRRLDVPRKFEQAGWYRGSALPGQLGPTVIVGHVDSRAGPAVFNRLRELRPGDPTVITRTGGSTTRFVVERLRTFAKAEFPASAVYSYTARPTLRLITCAGPFDPIEQRYVRNLVVFASMVQADVPHAPKTARTH